MMRTVIGCGVFLCALLTTSTGYAETGTDDDGPTMSDENEVEAGTTQSVPAESHEVGVEASNEGTLSDAGDDVGREENRLQTAALINGDSAETANGRRPGFGLWVAGIVTGLVGFGAGIAGMALIFSEECATESCPEWIVLAALGVSAFVAGIVMVTVGRRRMRRARALPHFMRGEAVGWRLGDRRRSLVY